MYGKDKRIFSNSGEEEDSDTQRMKIIPDKLLFDIIDTQIDISFQKTIGSIIDFYQHKQCFLHHEKQIRS